MEFKKAEQIHDIIEALRHYENEYIRFNEQYESISGHLNDGVNGIGFTWKKNSEYYQAIVDMLQNNIQKLKKAIENFEVNEDER